MTSPVRSPRTRMVARPPAEPPYPRTPEVELDEPPPTQRRGSAELAQLAGPAAALECALSIATAASEDVLLARTVEAAGRLTQATVAGTVADDGTWYTWGNPELAGRLLNAIAARDSSPTPTYTQDPLDGDQPDRDHSDQETIEQQQSKRDLIERDGLARLGLLDTLTADLAGAPLAVAVAEPKRFDPQARRLLGLVVAHATAGRDRLREFAVLARRADCDPLTGLRHYRPFEERLAASVPGRTAVIVIDIDNFKQINDRHGHPAGDAALVALVGALSRALRGDDHIYRIGGDEFAVVVEVAAPAEVAAISRRLLRAARSAGYPISVGAALCSAHEGGRETLLRADQALYQAKRAGRNTARLAA